MNEVLVREEKMRLFVRIQGLSPIQLHQYFGLSTESCIAIVNSYYQDLYIGKPPGPLFPVRVINFNNGDKLIEFKRKEGMFLFNNWLNVLIQLHINNIIHSSNT